MDNLLDLPLWDESDAVADASVTPPLVTPPLRDGGVSLATGHGDGARRPWLVVCALFIAAAAVAVGWSLHGRPVSTSTVATGGSESATVAAATAATTVATAAGTGAYTLEVDIQGDVRKPGVVTLPETSRVQDAVRAAGGFMHAADASAVNTAAVVTDGEEIVIPGPTHTLTAGGQSEAAVAASTAPAERGATLLDLNSATEVSLETLPGIGPGRASAIIGYRAAHGPFVSVEQLRQVHGIGPITYGRIAPYLTVGGQS